MTLRCRDCQAAYSGLQHCGSVWSCPVCGASILVHRALEIGAVLGQAIAQGHQLAFVTLTLPHRRSQSLEHLWSSAQAAWQRAISGRTWRTASAGVEGWVRVWEVQYGLNGWHPHVHCVLVLAPDADGRDVEAVASGMFGRWSKGLISSGLDAPLLAAQDWQLVRGDQASSKLADYLVKMVESSSAELAASLGLELTHSMPGRAAESFKTRPVWSLLDELVATGEKRSLDLWHEWEAGSKGKRQVGWSKGLRERFAPEVEELTDAEVVDQELGSAADDVLGWDFRQWREFVRVPGRLVELLEVSELGGAEAARELLDRWGVEYLDGQEFRDRRESANKTPENRGWREEDGP